MKKFSVDLIEDNYAYYFSIDHCDKKEYSFKKRSGLRKRSFDKYWNEASFELNSITDAAKHMDKAVKAKRKDADDFSFQPAKIMDKLKQLQEYLQSLDEEWKIILRGRRIRKIILKKSGKELESLFRHYGILIKVKLRGSRRIIELGEGNGDSARFNQDGLITRLKETIRNHKEQLKISFSGGIPIILNAGDGGILLHEILGHALEADYIFHGRSPISIGDMGRQIMPEHVTVTTSDKQDPFFKGVPCDDEGETPKSSTLVEKGVLKNIIADNFYKNLLNIKSGGHGRLEDFTKQTLPRMYALYLKPGDFHPQELVESTPLGVFAREFGEGKIVFDKNLFYFHIHDARMIEKGKKTVPLGNIVVRGDIREVLGSIEKVANDFRYDKGISYCFKKGQTLNVRVGQPTVKINNLYVTKEIDE
ncbi:MAG: TldD/PmbA family protein [bacterium]|nr:TldD/PmbA family protein [bacterium]